MQKATIMKDYLSAALREATRLTKAGRLAGATAALQGILDGQEPTTRPPRIRFSPPAPAPQTGGRFLARTFASQEGRRPYKLYIPTGYDGQPVPLVVMLHGCTQSPDDFAVGTRMNVAGEARTCLVAYPGQTHQANAQKCWNWFNQGDQRRDAGEPSLIAGITRQILQEFTVDPSRVYVAGLSAGGAAAAIMGDAYPDLFAAIGVHSGLGVWCGAGHAVSLRGDAAWRGRDRPCGDPAHCADHRFPWRARHYSHPRNADAVVAQAVSAAAVRKRVETGRVPGGHAYSRTLFADATGKTVVEEWLVQGAGHAWFGGSPRVPSPIRADRTRRRK